MQCPDQKENQAAERGTERIENQIIDIRGARRERKLKQFDAERKNRSREHVFPVPVDASVQDRQDHPGRDEHRDVADQIQREIPFRAESEDVSDRDRVDPERIYRRRIEHERLNSAVYALHRIECEAQNHREIYVHQQKQRLTAEIDASLHNPHNDPD